MLVGDTRVSVGAIDAAKMTASFGDDVALVVGHAAGGLEEGDDRVEEEEGDDRFTSEFLPAYDCLRLHLKRLGMDMSHTLTSRDTVSAPPFSSIIIRFIVSMRSSPRTRPLLLCTGDCRCCVVSAGCSRGQDDIQQLLADSNLGFGAMTKRKDEQLAKLAQKYKQEHPEYAAH
jgi:hypothetical protein